jgi:PPOX class probable F420-dependent enzyme
MDLAEARQFLATHHCAVLTTRRRDGRLQMSPVTVGVDAAGRAIVSSRETAYKTRHLRRDPHASLCVFVEAFHGPWVQIDGTTEVLALPDAMEPLVDYYRRIAGEHSDWDLDSGVFCCLTLVDTESAPRPEDSRSIWPPPDRLSPAGCGHVHSGVAARHRPENAIVPWLGHGSSAIVKTRRPGRQWQTTFLSLRTTAPESRPNPNAV